MGHQKKLPPNPGTTQSAQHWQNDLTKEIKPPSLKEVMKTTGGINPFASYFLLK
jgi:hypothetical protein